MQPFGIVPSNKCFIINVKHFHKHTVKERKIIKTKESRDEGCIINIHLRQLICENSVI